MDRRERFNDPEELGRLLLHSLQARMWTSLPGIVQKFDAAKMTVDVQPALNGRTVDKLGAVHSVQIPVLLDCPVVWPGGGGATLTFPVAVGDECLVVFASRCIDSWWDTGEVRDPLEMRMHNLSDGFALIGVRSRPKAFAVNASAVQLRTNDGTAYVEINTTTKNIKAHTSGNIVGEAGGTMALTAPGGVTINGVTIDSSGNVVSPAAITALTVTGTTSVTGGGKSLSTHTHSGVQTGSGNTGAPV